MFRATALFRLTARLVGIVPFAALLYAPPPASANSFDLGMADSFAVLGALAITNNNATTIQGDLGIAPGLAGAITGLGSISITGTVFAGVLLPDPIATLAQSNAFIVRNALLTLLFSTDLTGQNLGGLTLTPGIYKFSSEAQLTGTLTLNAQGNPNALFVFQIGSALTTASGSEVDVINGRPDTGVFWEVGDSATLGADTLFAGNILADQSITLGSSAKILCGRAIALNAAVTMDKNTISNDCTANNGDIIDRTDFGSGGFRGQSVVPEPTTFLLWGTVAAGLGLVSWHRRRRAA